MNVCCLKLTLNIMQLNVMRDNPLLKLKVAVKTQILAKTSQQNQLEDRQSVNRWTGEMLAVLTTLELSVIKELVDPATLKHLYNQLKLD